MPLYPVYCCCFFVVVFFFFPSFFKKATTFIHLVAGNQWIRVDLEKNNIVFIIEGFRKHCHKIFS